MFSKAIMEDIYVAIGDVWFHTHLLPQMDALPAIKSFI